MHLELEGRFLLSSAGTYTSVTIEAPVASSAELYDCYAVLRNDPRVRMAL